MSEELNKTLNNKEYNIILKSQKVYCRICDKRCGKYNTYCGPSPSNPNLRNWKKFRKTKYKI